MVERMSDRRAHTIVHLFYTVRETGSGYPPYSKHTWFSISRQSGTVLLYCIKNTSTTIALHKESTRPVLNVPTVDMGCKR